MKNIFVGLALVIVVVTTQAQQAPFYFGTFGDGFAQGNGFFDALNTQAAQPARDPRQDRGPVVFPPAPPDSGETSGVVVGASGFGFVPPNRQGVPGASRFAVPRYF